MTLLVALTAAVLASVATSVVIERGRPARDARILERGIAVGRSLERGDISRSHHPSTMPLTPERARALAGGNVVPLHRPSGPAA